MDIKCFLLEATGEYNLYFRRYHSSLDKSNKCPLEFGYHNASIFFKTIPANEPAIHRWDINDPRWPKQCGCGYTFTETDEWQIFNAAVYIRKDTGETYDDKENFPPGAIWRVTWYEKDGLSYLCGPDGQSWACQTPCGAWFIDSRASNCTLPNDSVHKCWCRHEEAPNFTVNKVGNTCAAGGGSIVTTRGDRTYHGFLTNGVLRDC
jgi:hypothetical protein